MHSDQAAFWDQRYLDEGPIWGEQPSPTAQLAIHYLRTNDRVLDVGFGYGRDLRFLMRHGYRVSGIDLSNSGLRHATELFQQERLHPELLTLGRFEDSDIPQREYHGIISHRVVHLLITADSVQHFVDRVRRSLRPNGHVFIAARNTNDLDRTSMIEVDTGVYEYANRAGHRIRYWDNDAFIDAFGGTFDILSLQDEVEFESQKRPVPCHFTIMAARLKSADGMSGVVASRQLSG